MTDPRVSAIVSTSGAERFIRGCREDLVAQPIIDDSAQILRAARVVQAPAPPRS